MKKERRRRKAYLPDFLAGAFRPAGITVMLHTCSARCIVTLHPTPIPHIMPHRLHTARPFHMACRGVRLGTNVAGAKSLCVHQ